LTKITYLPYQEVIVHEIVEQDNKTFFEDIVRQALATTAHAEPTVNWIDGIAFFVYSLPPTEDVVKENLKGKIHYSTVIFTRADFQNQVNVKISNQAFSVRMRNANNNAMLIDLAGFLKGYKPEGVQVMVRGSPDGQ
jgi:hypothetical protein